MSAIKPYFSYKAKASDRDLINSTVNYRGVTKRYFSSLDAEIYIGEEHIIDISKIDFNYSEQKLPMYGFNSFIPSRIFVGQKIVQGTFVINFTEVGYIANLLEKITPSDYSSTYDKVGVSCDPANAPTFAKCFDILIGYGGYNVSNEQSLNNTCQIIKGAYINGFQQVLDISGEPIYEMYSFIAKDIIFDKKPPIMVTPEPNDAPQGKGGKGMTFNYGIADNSSTQEVSNIKINSSNDPNYVGVIANVTHSILSSDSSLIEATFQLLNDENNEIENVKLTISDNEIGLSKTYTLNYYNASWVFKLDKIDTDKIKSKLKSGKSANCFLEFDLRRKNLNTVENLNKNIAMHKNTGY